MAHNNKNSLFTLQHDWDDILWKLEGEVWISYKVKDEASVHGKIQCLQLAANGLPKLFASNGFAVEWIAKDCLKVCFKDVPYSILFIPASKVYSGIHTKGILSLSISPRGLSVSACKDNQLLVWDFKNGELKCDLSGHVGDVYRCKFFPSGVVVLSGGADMQLKIWCANTGKCPVTLIGHTMAVTDFDFIDKGKNVLSVSKDGTAKLWCCASASCIGDIAKLSSTINCCQVITAPACLNLGSPESPPSDQECDTEGKAALLGCEDGSVHVVAIHSRKMLHSFHCASAINTIAYLSGEYFLVGCQSGEILLFSLSDTDGPVKVWFVSNSSVLCIVAYKEYGFFSSFADGYVMYRHIKHDDKRVVLTGPNCDPVYEISTDNQFVYTCCRDALIRRYAVERIICNYINE